MNDLITLHIRQTADLLATYRVSQDGWAKVLERTVTDLHDLAAALQSGKIVAHVPTHLTGIAPCGYPSGRHAETPGLLHRPQVPPAGHDRRLK